MITRERRRIKGEKGAVIPRVKNTTPFRLQKIIALNAIKQKLRIVDFLKIT